MMKKPKAGVISERQVMELSDFERAKTVLVLLEAFKKNHPREKEFRWKPAMMLSPLRDEFEMDRAFEILNRETNGNVRARYEKADVFSEASGKLLGMHSQDIFLRIKNDEQFFKDCKRIFAKREKELTNSIEKIEIVENEGDDKLRVFVNGDYSNQKITPKRDKKFWDALLTIVREKKIVCENHRSAKNLADFFNTNQNNMLYTRSGFALSEILTRLDCEVSARIPIKIIGAKSITQRNSKIVA